MFSLTRSFRKSFSSSPLLTSFKRHFKPETANNVTFYTHNISSSLTMHQIPAFNDNYIYFTLDKTTNDVTVIDPGDSKPTIQLLKLFGYELNYVLLTHHHNDHIGGIYDLKKAYPNCKIVSTNDILQNRKLPIDLSFNDNDLFKIGSLEFKVFNVPGHTKDHCAFYNKQNNVLFIGDTLFSLGCGRLFEGTPAEMYSSLDKVKSVCNCDTLVFCGHEYTLNNTKFALELEGNNNKLIEYSKSVKNKRQKNEWTIPCNFGNELETNPFLRCDSEEIRSYFGFDEKVENAKVFKAIREAKDKF